MPWPNPMDAPDPRDPGPPSDLSMIEVAQRSGVNAAQQLARSNEYMCRAAIKLIADGENPRVVARACGFDDVPLVDEIQTESEDGTAFTVGQLMGYGPTDPMDRFVGWIQQGVQVMVRGWRADR
jgi:hypothetical protein